MALILLSLFTCKNDAVFTPSAFKAYKAYDAVNANDAVPTNIEEVCELSKSPIPAPPPPPNMVTNTPSEPDGVTLTPLPVKLIFPVCAFTNELVWYINKSVPPCPAFNAYDAVSAYDELTALNTAIEDVCEFLTKFSKSPNAAKDAELNPTILSATPALIAYDDDNTLPITLSPGIVPFINEPPLPITTFPEVNPANLICIVFLSIDLIVPAIIWSSEPVAYICTIG